MKKIIKLVCFVGLTMYMSSCYTYTYNIGDGAQSGATFKEKNHYFIGGLAKGKQANHEEMAGKTKDYTVTVKHSFIDGLINGITFGIYTPTTTTVQK